MASSLFYKASDVDCSLSDFADLGLHHMCVCVCVCVCVYLPSLYSQITIYLPLKRRILRILL